MGFFTALLTSIGLLKRKVEILCIGLDNSGKTSILTHFQEGRAQETIPTIGFQVKQFSTARLSFTAFDMSGQGRYRDLWPHYFEDANAVVFVIDSSDRTRICVVRDELELMLQHKVMKFRKIPILFFANKMDVEGIMNASEISDAIGLEHIKDRRWSIYACNALTGEGLAAGLDWLTELLLSHVG